MKKGGNLMKCSNCNKEIEDGSAFCAFCGAKVENDAKVQETVPEVEEKPVEDVKEEKAETTEQAANEEVKVEEKKEEVKIEEKNETEKVEKKEEDTTKVVDPKKNQRHSIITIGIVAVVAIVLIIVFAIALCSKNSEQLFKGFIKSAISETYAGEAATANSANVSASVELSTDISELKSVVDGLKVESNVQYNLDDQQVIFGLNLDKSKDSYLALKTMADLKQNQVYVGEANIYDKLISAQIPEEYQEVIKEYVGEDGLSASDKAVAKKAAKKIYTTLNNNLSKDLFKTEKVTVNINGKDKKVKDNTLTIKSDDLKTVLTNTVKSLKMDNEFLACYKDRNEIIDVLDSFEEAIDDADDEDATITIHYYTSGMTNKFVGIACVVKDDYYNDEYILEVVNTSKNVYEINVKQTEYKTTQAVASATLTVNKDSKKEKDYTISMNIENEGKIEARLVLTQVYNKGIEALDTSSAVDYKNLTDDDMEKISDNFENSKLYETFSTYIDDALSSLGIGGSSNTSSKRDVPAGITLKKGQSFVESYDDDVVVFDVPETFEEEYSGLSYQRFSKDDKTKETAYIDVDCNYDSLEEYEDGINDKLDYYSEEEGYTNVKISDREEIQVNGVTFYKKTFTYTYKSGSYSYTSTTDYYYTPINDEYVYSVEVDDEDKIVTSSEIEKLLTIDVTLAK